MPARRTRSPSPCRTRTELISRRRGSSRAVLNNPEAMDCDLFAFLRLGLLAQCIRNAGQHATGEQCHSDARTAHCREPRIVTHAAGKLPHHGCDTCACLYADVLSVSRTSVISRRRLPLIASATRFAAAV